MSKITKKILLSSLLLSSLIIVGCSPTVDVTDSNDNSNSTVTPTEPVVKDVVSTTKLVTYDGPQVLESSSLVDIKVNDTELFVYETRVNHNRTFSFVEVDTVAPVVIFDFEGTVSLDLTLKTGETVDSVVVRPLDFDVDATFSGSSIKFDISYPTTYIVEYNGLTDKAIHIIANPIEENPLTEETADVYIGPGVYSAGAIPVQSNQTVYIAGGAVVYGSLRGEGLENVTLRGRGIISGAIYERQSEAQFTIPVEFRHSNNITIEGLTFLDPAGWTILLYNANGVNINNIKIMTARANGDGISIQGSKNVTVDGGFVRSWDDSLVVKAVGNYSTENILIKNVSVWTDLAQSLEVGYETNGDYIKNVTFDNITVFHNFHKPVASIHVCDKADVSQITFKNITVEDGELLGDDRNSDEDDLLFDLTIKFHPSWSVGAGSFGTIKDVLFDNVKVIETASENLISKAEGDSASSNIDGVEYRNIEIEGGAVKSLEDLNFVKNDYVSDVKVTSNSTTTGATPIRLYELDLKDDLVNITKTPTIAQEGVQVPEFAISKGELPFMGSEIEFNGEVNAYRSAGITNSTPGSDGSGSFAQTGYEASNVVDGDRNTMFKSKDFSDVENEFANLEITFSETQYVGVIRLMLPEDNTYSYDFMIEVRARRVVDGEEKDTFSRILARTSYSISPATNNIVDIKINPYTYKAFELRMFKLDSVMAQDNISLSEVKFFGPSISHNKAIVDSTPYSDVYVPSNLTDGDTSTYYEASSFPGYVVIDLGAVYNVKVVTLSLPSSLAWGTRTQEIEMLGSDSNVAYTNSTSFTQFQEKTNCIFDPTTGNSVKFEYESGVSLRFLKVVIHSNDILGNYGGQLSEVSVFA